MAEEERGFVPALIWHGVESKVKARRAALHLTAGGEVGKLFLQKPRENREAMRTVASNPRANRSITLSTNAGHNAGQRAARAAENAGNWGNFFFFFATTTCLFAKRDNAHSAILS